MKSANYWQELDTKIAELEQLRKELSNTIHSLKCARNQHKTQQAKKQPRKYTKNSLSFQMFGKPSTMLTQAERTKYYTEIKRRHRERKKEQKQ